MYNDAILPQLSFNVLLVLAKEPNHGYNILQCIKTDSLGHLTLGAGALYTTLKRLANDGLIEELPNYDDHKRRHYYRLTRKGWNSLTNDMEYYRQIVRIGNARVYSPKK